MHHAASRSNIRFNGYLILSDNCFSLLCMHVHTHTHTQEYTSTHSMHAASKNCAK